MIKKQPTTSTKRRHNKHTEVTAASFRRIAKALRVRARNHKSTAKRMHRVGGMIFQASLSEASAEICTGLAEEFDHEARTLRAMR